MRNMKWYLLYLVAIIRGLFFIWPRFPDTPSGYHGVHCELRNWKEARTMYKEGWIPYAIQKIKYKGFSPIARMFIVRN